MKKIFILLTSFSFLLLLSCQNELYKDAAKEFQSEQGVFLNRNFVQIFLEEGQEASINELEVSLSKKTEKLYTVNLQIGNQSQLDNYNKKNQTNYILLPKEMYEIAEKITFDPKYTSNVVPIKLKNIKFSTNGAYALPIKVVSRDANAIGGQEESIIVLEQRVRTKSLRLDGYGAEDGKMFPNDFKVNEWTMEVTLNRKFYSTNNRSIGGTKLVSGSSLLDEIYARFGDVTIKPNQLQIKTGRSQIDVPASKFEGIANTWHTLSFVYDGKMNSVYADGVLVASREMRTGPYGLVGFWIGGANELIREVRFWSVARTQKQIQEYRWKLVNPDEEGLLLYYPMNGKKYNRETGKIEEDETKIWDWSKNEKHLNMPPSAVYDNNGGEGFVFPPIAK